jgi:hypothetical protein
MVLFDSFVFIIPRMCARYLVSLPPHARDQSHEPAAGLQR